MKKLGNFYNAFLGISFMIWFFASLITPFSGLFDSPTSTDYFLAFNTFIVVGFITVKVLPKAIKNATTDLNFKIGSTKKSEGCSSCKRKKKID